MSRVLPDHFVLDDMSVEVVSPGYGEEERIIDGEERLAGHSEEESSPGPSAAKQAYDWKLKRLYCSVAILCLVNLLNYMDRFTVAGVLTQIKDFYGIDDALAGALQTAFICSYMVFAPIFGFLGDRYSRKKIMAVGIFIWSLTTLAGSFVSRDMFWLFISLRGLVGIGEASYSTIAPTLIADMFTKDKRSLMLMIFYFFIPVGSGLGYIVGSNVAAAAGSWQWGLRVTPALGVVCVFLIICFLEDPARGEAEGAQKLGNTSWFVDLRSLCKNKSFLATTLGFTAVAFVAGALSWYAPMYMQYATEIEGNPKEPESVSLIFGAITCAAGLIGVAVGAQASRRIKRSNPRADPLVCAFGLLACAPFLYFALVASEYNSAATWVLIFIGETLLCLNWSVQADIVLYVVVPTRRSTAEAFQILFSHLFGDAGSPYLIGSISDILKGSTFSNYPSGSTFAEFFSLQYAMYITAFVSVCGGASFLACALCVESDKARVEKIIKEVLDSGVSPQHGDDKIKMAVTFQDNPTSC